MIFNRPQSTATVRYLFPAVASGAVLFGLLQGSNNTPIATVQLEAPVEAISVGDTYAVKIYANTTSPSNAVSVQMVSTGDAAHATSIDTSQSIITLWVEEPTIETNPILFSGGTYARGFVGKHEIATVYFYASTTGQHDISLTNLQLISSDGTGTPLVITENSQQSISVQHSDKTSLGAGALVSVSEEAATLSDLDHDGEVTLRDISIFMGVWQNKSRVIDLNQDGEMDFSDFSILLSSFFI